MSISLMSAVFESTTLGPTERLVMLALADHADDDGRCYPSIARLCRRTGLSERAVQTNIRKLVEQGYIRIIAGGGKGNSNLYFVSTNPAASNETTIRSGPRMPDAKGRFAIYLRDNNTCVYCGYVSPDGEENLTLDHVVPQSRGGDHSPENLVTCCQDCNRRKKNKTPDEWIKPRSRCTPQQMHPAADAPQTPQQVRANPAADAPEPSRTPIEPSTEAAEDAREIAPKADEVIDRITHALGFDRNGLIPKYWAGADAPVIVGRWMSELQLTPDEIVRVAQRNSIQHGSPARGPKILTPHMAAFASAKTSPIAPPEGAPHDQHRPYADRRQTAADAAFERRILAAARARPAPG